MVETDSVVCFCGTGEILYFCQLSVMCFRVFSNDAAIVACINPFRVLLPSLLQDNAFRVSEIIYLSSVTSIFK